MVQNIVAPGATGVVEDKEGELSLRPKPLILLCSALLLCGCATLDGRPTPVISVKQADMLVVPYAPDKAIEDLNRIPATDVAGRNTYRDRVIHAYLAAIDAHYNAFLRDLSRSGKGVHLGLDTSLLLLTGAGAIFSGAASDISAGATALGGIRSSYDREILADKTIPILISLMDSRRLAVRADILRGESRPESIYTLEDAFADLTRYEGAGTIDGALSDAAANAGVEAKETKYDFSKAKDLCTVDSATDQKRRALMIALESFERKAEGEANPADAVRDRTAIQKAAQALGMAAASVPADKGASLDLLAMVRDRVEAQCTAAGVDALKAKIIAQGVKLQ